MKNSETNKQGQAIDRKEFGKITRKQTPQPEDLDAFEQTALEGFRQMNSSPDILNSLDQRFLHSNAISWTSITSVALSIILFSGFIWFVWLRPNEETTVRKTPVADRRYELSDLVLPPQFDTMHTIEAEKIIPSSELVKNFKQQRNTQESDHISNPDKAETKTYRVEVDSLPNVPLPDISPSNKLATSKNMAKEVYLGNLKAIDYRAYRSKPSIPIEQIIIGGTPANQENDEINTEELPERKTASISYHEYLSKSMSLFEKGQYKRALYRFQKILEHYPSDLNALFYGGLCQYNLGQFKQAENMFLQSQTHNFRNFDEDSQWYVAKSMLEQKRKSEAQQLLRKISDQNGFYAEQARELLQN
ncbi:MAG: tetratricopeptide repeat protein [Bacteroidetes bacterium]|nr:MAG: tetratricopeptide repeat protein [Bacteroidota bacterium]